MSETPTQQLVLNYEALPPKVVKNGFFRVEEDTGNEFISSEYVHNGLLKPDDVVENGSDFRLVLT